ncbi:MAG: cobalamin-binding protein [Limnochordia bacterium]|jgi:hypothetical protein|nr:MAG: cobalamin-binding protein [Peptococcaceae bacterium 1109]
MSSIRYAFLKPTLDAHTLGINAAVDLVRDCGYEVIVGDQAVSEYLNEIQHEKHQEYIIEWLRAQRINRVGLTYRLDPEAAVDMVGYFIRALRSAELLSHQGGPIDGVFFAGLPSACERIEKEHKGLVVTFGGGESPSETLVKLNVPSERIPRDVLAGSGYDDFRLQFGSDVINSQEYLGLQPVDRSGYPEFGTRRDTVERRLQHALKHEPFYPLMRAHCGPYDAKGTREESVKEFIAWARQLGKNGYLDILSIGTSQLTQSNFGENWGDRPNGGGVPINSPEEYREVWENSRPLLLRTYAGTKRIPELAAIHEETINICWHALSLWWFNQLDGRGPYDLYTNLQQHVEALRYIAQTGKPFEANVSHHFAFRGADDVTYIVSAYLAAKLAKSLGIRTYILQNMLNTPRMTWGVQDLAKSRAMLTLLRELEGPTFRVILQPRAGLDYFRPDLYEAKVQLAAVTALMDDIEPLDETSPPIIHVVSYSEAVHLATPDIIDDSVKITLFALKKYRELRKGGAIEDMSANGDVAARQAALLRSARIVIASLERHIPQLYTPEGLYLAFAAGFLPTPFLWNDSGEYQFAKRWNTKSYRGGTVLVDEQGKPISPEEVVNYAVSNLPEGHYLLKEKAPQRG